MSETKKNLLEQILDGAIDLVKKPFTIKRVNRAFESAKDSLEEQILSVQAQQTTAREDLVKTAKEGNKLETCVQVLIDLQMRLEALQSAQKALSKEEKELLS